MAVTIKDIARICNVLEGTVDRALNNRKGINPKTKERILQVAKLFQYKPNSVARSLATGTTKTIGIICFDLYNNFFAELIDIVEEAAKNKGYFINLILSHGDVEKELEGIEYLASRRVDGLIIFPVGQGTEYINNLKRLKIPVVTIYNKISDDFVYIGVDDRKIMKEAVHLMASKGYERILFYTVNLSSKRSQGINVYSLEQRLLGYLDGLNETGIQEQPIIIEGKAIEKLLPVLLDNAQGFKTGILCTCDTYALNALEYCKKNGIKVPDQLGIMGFDNIDMLKYITPRLATVEYDEKLLGYKLFNVLYDLIKGREISKNLINDHLFIEGESL